ncbi:MAG: phage minor head protein [Achromobacter sp.]|uniref:phage minor head protein n=1 Tax=Achromobacter sp. TaxID=134375 RepID=UPI003D093D6A
MADKRIKLDDAATELMLDALRVAAGLDAEAQAELRKLAIELRGILGAVDVVRASSSAIERLLAAVDAAASSAHAAIAEHQLAMLATFADVIQHATAETVGTRRRTAAFEIVDAVFAGATPKEVWKNQGAALHRAITREVRIASLDPKATTQALVTRIVGDAETPGLMRRAAKTAKTLTEGVTLAVAGQAQQALLRSADDVLSGYRWSARFDSKTCMVCGGLDGKLFTLTGEPVGHQTPLQGGPPRHPGCRCVLVPEPLQTGVGAALPGADGTLSRGPTFEQWLSRKSDKFKRQYFGPGRLELWKDGKLTLTDLLDMQGNPLTLEQLRAKYEISAPR